MVVGQDFLEDQESGQVLPRWRSRLGEVPRLVWLLTALFGLLTVTWTVVSPLGRAPDEPAHFDLVTYVAESWQYPDWDARASAPGPVHAAFEYAPREGGIARLTPEGAIPRSDRPTLEERNRSGGGGFAWTNQMPQHPPLYYWVAAAELSAVRWLSPGGDDAPLDREWHVVRLLSVALVLPLPLLAWASARRLGLGASASVTAAAVPLAIPQVTHIGASINNDNLVLLFGAIAAYLVAGVLRGDDRIRSALLLGLACGLAISTKANAVFLAPWVLLAYAHQARTSKGRWRASLGSLAAAGGVIALVGGAWPIRNRIRHGEFLPKITSYVRPPEDFQPNFLEYFPDFASRLTYRFWGRFGWYEAPLSVLSVVLATAVVVFALISLASMWRRSATGTGEGHPIARSGWALVIFGSLFPMLVAFVLYIGWSRHIVDGRTPFIQGRYLFVALVPFVVVVGAGLASTLRRWAPALVLAGAVLIQLDGFRVALRVWWAEPGASLRRSAQAAIAWSPWPPLAIYILMIVLVATIVFTAVAMGRWLRAESRPDRIAPSEALTT